MTDNDALAQELEALIYKGVEALGLWAFANRTAIYDALRTPAPAPVGGDVVWMYELAQSMDVMGSYSNWIAQVSRDKPCVPEGSIRHIRPLYAALHAQATGDCHET